MVVVTHGETSPAREAAVVAAGERTFTWARSNRLRLYVQTRCDLGGWSPRHLALVDEAMREWMRSGAVRVEYVSRSYEADIRVYWTDRLPPTNPGVTLLYRARGGKLSRADVFVRVEPAPWNTGSPDRVLYGTIAHELGHALGLAHDAAPDALMHPAPLVTHVTQIDMARLEELIRGG